MVKFGIKTLKNESLTGSFSFSRLGHRLGPPDRRFGLEVAIFVLSITSRGTTTLNDALVALGFLHQTATSLRDRGSGWS
jgi:hypothetical protein